MEQKKNKTRVTVFATTNIDGSDKRRLMLINKSRTPIAFRRAKVNSANLPVTYRYNKKAWMLSGIWYEYLRGLEANMKAQGRRIALLADNAPTHPPPNRPPVEYKGPPPPILDHVKLIYLPPNTTAWLQPLDAGIIRSLKAGYRRKFVQYIVNYFEKHGTAAPNLDVLQVIYLIAEAWDELPPQTVFHCWQKVGLVAGIDSDRDERTSYEDYLTLLQQSANTSMQSLLDFDCNSQQVEDLTNNFLFFDEDAPDEDARAEDISIQSVIADIRESKDSESDTESVTTDSETAEPDLVSLTDADCYLDKLTIFLERLSVDSLPIGGKPMPIPDVVQSLRRLRGGLRNYSEENKKQSTLTSWLRQTSGQTSQLNKKATAVPGRLTDGSPWFLLLFSLSASDKLNS